MSDTQPVDRCESIQEYLVHQSLGEWTDIDRPDDIESHVAQCAACSEASQQGETLSKELAGWQEILAETTRMDVASQRKLDRHLAQLVREDVARRFHETSLRARLSRRIGALGAACQELSHSSVFFRALTTAALLVALLLVGFLALELNGRPADASARDEWLPLVDEPVHKHFSQPEMNARNMRRRSESLPGDSLMARPIPKKR